ncbi:MULTISPECIES: hypothetical protein [unclassified Alteromonas]|uniref:hypothetical protein n=1 Tax=unclassified Alteromonas TaxID=2614992 RepID=UPI000509AF5B|nr:MULTISPECIES: hypothetical protein [unclassified Alteromonas]
MVAEPTIETIAEELSVAYDIILNILERFPDIDTEHAADWHLNEVIERLENVKAHAETIFQTFDKLNLVEY